MSQRDMLRDFDAQLAETFLAAGLADSATYQGLSGPAIPCTVVVDRASDLFGDDEAPVAGERIVIAIQLAQVPDPDVGATVTVGSEVFTLAGRIALDESLSTWVVTGG